jgi:hypothetical protein
MDKPEELVRRLLKIAGRTYAAEAGVKINDKPMPLFQLLVLCMLASKPIDAAIAMSAGRELFRYDESSATRLTDMAERVRDDYSGDLREIAEGSRHDVAAAKRMLKKFKGIGDTGADIYLREVQDVWPWVRPYFDDRATAAARQLGLPAQPAKLGALAPQANSRLAAGLVRASLDDDLRRQVAG